MNILYVGDVMGPAGIDVLAAELTSIRREHQVGLVIAQAENVTDGKGMSTDDMDLLASLGVDFFSGGNHTPKLKELYPRLEDSSSPVIGPANLVGCPGQGWKYISTPLGRVLVVSLMGSTVGTPIEIENPLKTIDNILHQNLNSDKVATIVNFHGDYSSEKKVIGHYLDGRVTAVIGDHWHIPTADAMILPGGTAHVTDVGMCGSLQSSLGVKFESIVPRWRDGIQTKNDLEDLGPRQFNAVLVKVNPDSGRAGSIERIQSIS